MREFLKHRIFVIEILENIADFEFTDRTGGDNRRMARIEVHNILSDFSSVFDGRHGILDAKAALHEQVLHLLE